MNKKPAATQAMILRCLIDGMGINPTARATGVAKTTVLRLLVEAGEFCAFYHDIRVADVRAPRLSMDEQWSFVGAKKGRSDNENLGDIWTFVCLASDSKLVVSYLCGARSFDNTMSLVEDASTRTTGRTQITTDGWRGYHYAIAKHFDVRADYVQEIKEYENGRDNESMRRYGTAKVARVSRVAVMGNPDMASATTSYVENLNLHTRQKCRRFARLTNQHSKTAANHTHAVALNFFAHNFMRVHATLTAEQGRKMTPAKMHRLAKRPWTAEDLVAAMDPKAVTIK